MLVGYKYRLYPNKNQKEYFEKCFGCVRFIYNRMLADKIEYYNKNKQKLNNTPAQYKKEFVWLKEVDSLALANAQINLQAAYNNFFNRPEIGFPKFKSKKDHQYSYTTNNQGNNIRIENGYINLPKIKWVKIKQHRTFFGVIKSVTITKTSSEKYYASILVEHEGQEKLKEASEAVGIDLGLNKFIAMFNGKLIDNPRFFSKSEARLRKLQKDLSRCEKGSKNREKCRIKVARQYEKIVNQRKDFLHKVSKQIIDENQIIVLETLDIQDMIGNRKLAKSITNVSWGELVRQLEYKSNWYGREVIRINPWFPSSQICSNCNCITGKKDLSVREWICPKCNTNHERDINAAINILNEGLRIKSVGTTRIA